jgi:hypothetical protein
MSALCRTIAVVVLGATPVTPGYCCTLIGGYESFEVAQVLPATVVDAAPQVTVVSIKRGYEDRFRWCPDFGALVLKVPSNELGYHFELVEGGIDDPFFPEGFVKPQGGEFVFVWLEGRRSWREPINVLVRITTISSAGVVSEPALLRVEHPGRVRVR